MSSKKKKFIWYLLLIASIITLSYVTHKYIDKRSNAFSEADLIHNKTRVIINLSEQYETEKPHRIKSSSKQFSSSAKDASDKQPKDVTDHNTEESNKKEANKSQSEDTIEDPRKTKEDVALRVVVDPTPDKSAVEQADATKSAAADNQDTLQTQESPIPETTQQEDEQESQSTKQAGVSIKSPPDNAPQQPTQDFSKVTEPIEKLEPVRVGRVALVVTGLGLSTKVTEQAIMSFPDYVTLGFSTYSADLERWVTRAREGDHEVLLSLPMEPKDYPISDPGPIALLTKNPSEKNLNILKWIMAQSDAHIGFYTEQKERFSFVNKVMEPILYHLRKHQMLMVYNNEEENATLQERARTIGLPFIVADLTIDDTVMPELIRDQLEITERIALTKGQAVVIARAYPITQDILNRWLATLNDKNIIVVPLSKLMQKTM